MGGGERWRARPAPGHGLRTVRQRWWAVVTLAAAQDDWPLPADEVGEITASLRWWLWDAYEPKTGWWLRLAVEDPDEGLAWAIAATDQSL